MKIRTPKCSHPWCIGCQIDGAYREMVFKANSQLGYVTREEAFETAAYNCMREHTGDDSET